MGAGGLTADEDFGEGGGLAVGVLHLHRVGACVLQGAPEVERGRSASETAGLPGKLKSPAAGGKGGASRGGLGLGRLEAPAQGPPLKSHVRVGWPLPLSTLCPPLGTGELTSPNPCQVKVL